MTVKYLSVIGYWLLNCRWISSNTKARKGSRGKLLNVKWWRTFLISQFSSAEIEIEYLISLVSISLKTLIWEASEFFKVYKFIKGLFCIWNFCIYMLFVVQEKTFICLFVQPTFLNAYSCSYGLYLASTYLNYDECCAFLSVGKVLSQSMTLNRCFEAKMC